MDTHKPQRFLLMPVLRKNAVRPCLIGAAGVAVDNPRMSRQCIRTIYMGSGD